MVAVAQLVRALDCGSRGRGFETHLPPKKINAPMMELVVMLDLTSNGHCDRAGSTPAGSTKGMVVKLR